MAVDDASTDGSPELLERAAAADSRIRVLRREGPPDLVAALELGRAAAEGRYLLRMDADDLAHPQRLELQQRALDRDPRVAAVGSLVRSFPHVTPGRLRYDRWLNGLRTHADMARERFVESPLDHPSVLLRAEPLERLGRDLDGPGGCAMTNIAPGIGYPTGWQNVSVTWGPTQALGIGAEVTPCDPVPTMESSWGRVKSLYR